MLHPVSVTAGEIEGQMSNPIRTILLAGAATLALTGGANAAASGSSSQQQLDALQNQLYELQAQVADLKRSQSQQYADVQTQAASGVRVSLKNGRPTLATADGNFTASLRSLVQFDVAYFTQGGAVFPPSVLPSGDLSSGSNFRRAQFGIQGTVFTDWNYYFNYDFGGSSGTEGAGRIQSAYVEFAGIPNWAFRIGAYPPPAGLEDQTSSTDTIFLERNSSSDATRNLAGGDGRDAASVIYAGDRFYGALSLTGGKTADGIGTFDEQQAALGRLSALALTSSDANLVFSANGTYVFRVADGAPGPGAKRNFSISDPPEVTVDSAGVPVFSSTTGSSTVTSTLKLVNTGNINSQSVWEWGLEAGGNWKNFYGQAGYFDYEIDRRQSTVPDDPSFHGWYAQATWVLTGEARPYNKATASFTAPKPDNPFTFDNPGWGAWELAARYSDLDLNYHAGVVGLAAPSGGVRGGEQRIISAGINWYPNNVVRFALDYQHIDLSKIDAGTLDSTGLPVPYYLGNIGQKVNVVELRSQVSF